MSDQKAYTPTETEVVDFYAMGRFDHTLRRPVTERQAEAEARRFVAKVKRDAAREALGGLAAEARTDWNSRHAWVAEATEGYRDEHYPEDVTPNE